MKKRVKKNKTIFLVIIILIIIVILLIGIFMIFKNPSEKTNTNSKGSLPTLGVHNNEVGIFSGGSGTPIDPYQISNCQELQNINNDLTANYVLSGNIDCSGFDFQAIASNYSNPFTGSLDGNGYEIDKLNVQGGLFNYSSGIIRKLSLIDIKVGNAGGGLVSNNLLNGIIENVYVSGNLSCSSGHDIGGLVGDNKGNITNCSVNILINYNITNSATASVGGLIGDNFNGKIINSYTNGNIYTKGKYYASGMVGGLVGSNSGGSGSIENSYSNVNIHSDGIIVGGFVGITSGIIKNCYSTGNIFNESNSSNSYRGGFVGQNINSNSYINNCYSIGNVYGSYLDIIGGFAALNYWSKITNSFSTGSLSGSNKIEGFAETITNSSDIINSYWYYQEGGPDFCYSVSNAGESNVGCTKITDVSYFYSSTNSPINTWDFDNIWSNVNDGKAYPMFKWKVNSQGSCNNDGSCNFGENCLNCAADCVCGTLVCDPLNPYSNIKGCTCQPNWQCNEWSPCDNWEQSRTCTDINSCGIESSKPIETQQCCSDNNNNNESCMSFNNNCEIKDSELLYAINKWVNQ